MYVLRCADGSYYSGHTDNLIQRLAQHEAGAIPTCYTVQRRPVALVYSQEFSTHRGAVGGIAGQRMESEQERSDGSRSLEGSRMARQPTESKIAPLIVPRHRSP